ncbi:MAG: cytochrome c [Acidimicrobiales bacterium]|nr:MAG: cytochrome c [Acidimicrobiales bacterium]
MARTRWRPGGAAPPPSRPERVCRNGTCRLLVANVELRSARALRLREPDLRAEAKDARQQEYVASGSTQFATNCASCHGDNGTGGTAPTLNSSQFLSQTTDEQTSLIIARGISGSDMSAWGIDYGGALTDQQIVTYIRSLEADAPSIPDWRRGAEAP